MSGEFQAAVSEWDQLEHSAQLEVPLTPRVNTQFGQLPRISFEEAWLYLKDSVKEMLHSVDSPIRDLPSTPLTRLLSRLLPCVVTTPLPTDLQIEEKTILALTKVQMKDDDEIHLRMLSTVYTALRGENPSLARTGGHWEVIGFQGTDPATDLRGVGVLGLLQLLWLTTHRTLVPFTRGLFDLSMDMRQNFPFAILCINMTRASLQIMKAGKLRRECSNRCSVIATLNLLFLGALHRFYEEWSSGQKTIADAGYVIKDVEQYLRQHTSGAISRAERKQKQQPMADVNIAFSQIL